MLANNNPAYIILQTMNIFVVSYDPVTAAKELCDKHVVKMIAESAQMLCCAYPDGEAPYKRAYYNHPCTVWARETMGNFDWLTDHALALCSEYTCRYGRIHKSEEVITWCRDNIRKLEFSGWNLTPFPQAMPDEYKDKDCAVTAYRAYYNAEKASFAKWSKSEKPDWFVS
jgi:hypothetical protein